MTEIIHLVEATPRNPGVGLVTVRMVSARSHARDTVKNSQSWIPALTSAPVQGIKFLGDDQMPGILEIDYGALGIRFSPDLGNDVWSAYVWEGADTTIWRGESGAAFGTFEKIFTGRCGALERQNANIGSIALRGYEGDLDRDLLSSTYAGTGGAEGDLAMKGVSKPWMSGPCEGVPGVLIDKVNWIWQLHGYGAIDDITAAYEGGLTLGSAHATVPTTYAALAALSMGGASWAKAPAVGMVRLGYEPSRPVVFDARGAKDGSTYVSKVGAIASHLLKVAGFESGDINSTSAGNLDTAFAHDWGYYTAMQASIGDVVRKALADIGGYAFPDESGIWRFGRYKAIKTATALKGDRSAAPIVRSVSQRASLSPIGRVEVGARRCWGVHREDEISPALLDALDKVDGVESGATQNAVGSLLKNTSFEAPGWTLGTGFSAYVNTTSGGWGESEQEKVLLVDVPTAVGTYAFPNEFHPCAPERPVYWRGRAARSSDCNRDLIITFYFYDAGGNILTTEPQTIRSSDAVTGGVFYDFAFSSTNAPTSAVYWRMVCEGCASFGVGAWRMDRWYPTTTAWGATNGADWSSNVTNRPTELTDGRVLAGLNSDGTIKAGKVGYTAMSADVLQEIVSATASNITATDTGAVMLSLEDVTVKPSQGGYVHLILTSAIKLAPIASPGGLSVIYARLQRSPANAGTWTEVQSWLLGSAKCPTYIDDGVGDAVDDYEITIGAAAQYIDVPGSDGDYDYRWLASKTSYGTGSTPASTSAGIAQNAQGIAISTKVTV